MELKHDRTIATGSSSAAAPPRYISDRIRDWHTDRVTGLEVGGLDRSSYKSFNLGIMLCSASVL